MHESMALSGGLLCRARGEYLEMPGLSLTIEQAQRLWALDHRTCSHVLSHLARAGFLRRRPDGSYIRQRTGGERTRATMISGG